LLASSTQTITGVSAVICTRNRPDKICHAVDSVLANDYENFELTVIDQSTNDQTEVALQARIEGDPRLRYLHVDEAGLSKAYNRAIRATPSEIIAFTDDDCVVPPDWITRIVTAFESEPEGDILYGPVLPAASDRRDADLTPFLRIGEPEKLSRRDGFRVVGMGANFATRRRLFDRIGVFDEVLGGGGPLRSSQDFDLAYRAYRSGSVILLRPEITLAHDGRRDEEDWPALLRNYGIGDGAFYSKHIRCGDMYALWLLARRVATQSARSLAKRTLRRGGGGERAYVGGILRGVRDGLRFDVDHRARLYVAQ
jgi:GT2 family glycosyltransferase